MAFKLFIITALVVMAAARPEFDRTPYSAPAHVAPEDPVRYDFSYGVNDAYSGTPHGHEETRDGELTKGIYYVQLPDGRLQQITYTVDGDSGFLAELKH
ncbi:cuticle protein 19-like [Penaeus japonicus]|uniref:cuticle protein 19-like n=1 Tax=Penaeus japonicus TaxID=27405 RepID=UPI001C717672|nr:cuticle protein 19-like [Penaeus japonicus]